MVRSKTPPFLRIHYTTEPCPLLWPLQASTYCTVREIGSSSRDWRFALNGYRSFCLESQNCCALRLRKPNMLRPSSIRGTQRRIIATKVWYQTIETKGMILSPVQPVARTPEDTNANWKSYHIIITSSVTANAFGKYM